MVSDAIESGNNQISWKTKILAIMGLFVIIICVIMASCMGNTPIEGMSDELIASQPLVFPNTRYSFPNNCRPWEGCFYPSTWSNSIDPVSGMHIPEKDDNVTTCEFAWRDCAAFQNCVDGKCRPKFNR